MIRFNLYTLSTLIILLSLRVKSLGIIRHASDLKSLLGGGIECKASSLLARWTVISTLALFPVPSIASDLTNTYTSTQGHFSFKYPDTFLPSPKLLKTHQVETLFSSESTKGYTMGVAVDPVKINSIREFVKVDQLADRVLAIEKAKEGYIDGKIVSATEAVINRQGEELPVYELDYLVETTRGQNHYLVRATIANKQLYVFTVQCKEKDYDSLKEEMKDAVKTLTIDS
eukprot:gene9813-10856_t